MATLTRITPSGAAYASAAETRAAIAAEAAKSADDAGGRPLPLAANWTRTYLPLSWQLTQIDAGHALLPWIAYNNNTSAATFQAYESNLQSLDSYGLPLTLIDDTNTFVEFANDAYFQALGVDDTGLAKDGTSKLYYSGYYWSSPYSPSAPWGVLGQQQTDTAGCAYLESVVTSPPLVLHIGNNENAGTGRRLLSYGTIAEQDDNFWTYVDYATYTAADADTKNQMRFDAAHYQWITNVGAWVAGELSGLNTSNWSSVYRTGSYWSYGDFYYANCNWGAGGTYPLVSTGDNAGEVDFAWHGFGSTTFELYDGYNAQDSFVGFELNCPNIRAMNLVFQRDYAYAVDPGFWFEVIIWDGEVPSHQQIDGFDNTKSTAYDTAGITYSADLYKGWLQYLLWCVQPRSLREFRYSDAKPDQNYTHSSQTYIAFGDYFDALIAAVDHVHQDSTLTRFWRSGTLVKNQTLYGGTRCGNPLNWHATGDFGLTGRWHHLTTDMDCGFWDQGTIDWILDHWKDDHWQQPIWTLAHVIGSAPNREWLIYAHSTGISAATLTEVTVTIPDYDNVVLPEVPVEGAFYLLTEQDNQIARPTSDVSSTGWAVVPDGSAYAALDETLASDTDYCATTATGSTLEVKLGSVTDPMQYTGLTLYYRGMGAYTASLRQGADTEIASWQENDATLTTHERSLTTGQAASITDYSDLRVRIVSGGS